MLRTLLALLAQEGMLSVEEAARRLNTEPELVRAMLHYLQRRGHAQTALCTVCGGEANCRACPWHVWCRPGNAPQGWRLTLSQNVPDA